MHRDTSIGLNLREKGNTKYRKFTEITLAQPDKDDLHGLNYL